MTGSHSHQQERARERELTGKTETLGHRTDDRKERKKQRQPQFSQKRDTRLALTVSGSHGSVWSKHRNGAT